MEHFANCNNECLDLKCKKFLSNPTPDNAFDILIACRCSSNGEFINNGIVFGEHFIDLFPYDNFNIINEVANLYFYQKRYDKSLELYQKALSKNLSLESSNIIWHNLLFTLNNIKGMFTYYTLRDVVKFPIKYVTMSITSCKRLDLFERTVNSFLNCVLDKHLISEYICVDDNSSESDRELMKLKYPFFTFYFKNESEKGHPKSMNIIKSKCNTKYLFHIEDDWEFIYKDNYISKCIHVLNSNDNIKQCLLNKNYGEITSCLKTTVGGEFHTTPPTKSSEGGIRYYIHEHMPIQDYINKYGPHRNCAYWPHYSFRPSIVDTEIFKTIGDFNESAVHFEMEYANRYVSKGYKSAFLEGIYCLHIGKLTSDQGELLNAYDLNNQKQFSECSKLQSMPYKWHIINLDRREDRWIKFIEHMTERGLSDVCRRFPAIDGSKLISNRYLRRIFDGNNYNWVKPVIGCALSHLLLWCDLIESKNSACVILEDDVQLCKSVDIKLKALYGEIKKLNDWDIIYLGTSSKIPFRDDPVYKIPTLIKRNRNECFASSFGGLFGYIISNQGAKKIINYISEIGMRNAIDTMIFNFADHVNVYFVWPPLVTTVCACTDGIIDTDIQNSYHNPAECMDISFQAKIEDELKIFGRVNIINNLSQLNEDHINISYNPGENIDNYKWYKFGNGSLYVSNKIFDIVKGDTLIDLFGRLSIDQIPDIRRCIQYKS